MLQFHKSRIINRIYLSARKNNIIPLLQKPDTIAVKLWCKNRGELDKLILCFFLILKKKIIQPSIDLLSIGIWCKYIAVQKPFVFELNMFLFCLKHLFVSLRNNRLFWHSHRGINNLFMLHTLNRILISNVEGENKPI